MDGEKFFEEVDCGGEYAWGLGYPFCNGGLSVSNMCATECVEDYDIGWLGIIIMRVVVRNRTIVRTLGLLRGEEETVAGGSKQRRPGKAGYVYKMTGTGDRRPK